MNRVTVTVLGFVLFGTGFVALLLGLMGLSLSPLVFLDRLLNPLGSFVAKIIIMLVGFIMFYVARTADEEVEEVIE
ncbi:MAG: hypothetical protein AAFQ02_06790 [Bacteroidota bacterium]